MAIFMVQSSAKGNSSFSSTAFFDNLKRAKSHAEFLCNKYHGGIENSTIEADFKKQDFSLIYAKDSIMSVYCIEKITVN